MSGMGRSGNSIEMLLKVAAIAALVIAGGQFLLDVVIEFVDHGEILFDEADHITNLLLGVISTAAIVAGVYWIVDAGTDEWVVVQAMGMVYVAVLIEEFLQHLILYEVSDLEVLVLLTSLQTVLYFLTFVIAYRMAFEDRAATDWDVSAVTSKF